MSQWDASDAAAGRGDDGNGESRDAALGDATLNLPPSPPQGYGQQTYPQPGYWIDQDMVGVLDNISGDEQLSQLAGQLQSMRPVLEK